GRQYWWLPKFALTRWGVVRPPANLLRNADFSSCTNPDIPDYWGTAAGAHRTELSGALRIGSDAAIRGTRALRLQNGPEDADLQLLAHPTFIPKPQAYTLSAYVRSDAGARVRLAAGWGAPVTFAAGKQW